MAGKGKEGEKSEKARPIEKWGLAATLLLGMVGFVIALELGGSADHLSEQSLITSSASLLAEQEAPRLCAGAHIFQFLAAGERGPQSDGEGTATSATEKSEQLGAIVWIEDHLLAPVLPAFNRKKRKDFQDSLTILDYRVYSSAHQNTAVPPSLTRKDPSMPLPCNDQSVGQLLSDAVVGQTSQVFIGYFGPPNKDSANKLKTDIQFLPKGGPDFVTSGTFDLATAPASTLDLVRNTSEVTLYFHDPLDEDRAKKIAGVIGRALGTGASVIPVKPWPSDGLVESSDKDHVSSKLFELWPVNREPEVGLIKIPAPPKSVQPSKEELQAYDLFEHLGDTDYPNQGDLTPGLSAPKAESEAVCAKKCLNKPECTAYTYLAPGVELTHWHGPKRAACFLKKNPWLPITYKGLVSGRLKQLPIPENLRPTPKQAVK